MYNYRWHSSIRMTLISTSKKNNESKAYYNLYKDLIYEEIGELKFKVADKVRISKYKWKILMQVTH